MEDVLDNSLVDKETWDSYSQMSRLSPGHIEYIQATKDITEKLCEIVVNGRTAEEIKQNIITLVEDRKKLISYADSHSPYV